MRTIFYLIDLYDAQLIKTFEGEDDIPSAEASVHADERMKATGHTHVLARGTLFFQKEVNFPATPPPQPRKS